MQSVVDQMIAFILVMILGCFVGVLFDCYRTLIVIWRPGPWGTIIGDVLFWIVVTSFAYFFLLLSTWGEVRLYVFLAMTLGLLLYFKFVSKKVRCVLECVYRFVTRVLKSIVKIILVPFKIFYRIVLFPVGLVVSFGLILGRGGKKLLNIMKKVVQRMKIRRNPPDDPPPENLS
ncbi:MAG: spore cortex biosynthesis protein YabQ [Bacillota bacterium]